MHLRLLRSVLCAALLAAGAAQAQTPGFDAQRFSPATGAAGGIVVERPVVAPHLGWSVGLELDYERNPLVFRTDEGVLSAPISDGFTADLMASLGLFDFLELALDLPLDLVYTGNSTVAFDGLGTYPAGAGLGDLRFVPKVAFGRTRTGSTDFLWGFALPLTLPTAGGHNLRGAGGVTVNPEVLLGVSGLRWALSFNAGFRVRPDASTTELVGDGITEGISASVALLPHSNVLDLLVELTAEQYVLTPPRPRLDNFPLEALAALDIHPHPAWTIELGGGAGLTSGLGTPDFRILAGVKFSPRPATLYKDSDRDGVPDAYDTCPTQAMHGNAYAGEDGCPGQDRDHDGVPDDVDECPDVPEGPGGIGDGCPADPLVYFRDGHIVVVGKIHFASGSADLESRSERTLDRLARLMREHRDIHHVRVDGHTDDTGGAQLNLDLSRARADRVRQGLITRGVSPGRLSARGFGETRPLVSNATPAGRAKNRRVEFTIE